MFLKHLLTANVEARPPLWLDSKRQKRFAGIQGGEVVLEQQVADAIHFCGNIELLQGRLPQVVVSR